MEAILIVACICTFVFLLAGHYTKTSNADEKRPWPIIKLALLCALGCGLGSALGGPVAICRAILLGVAMFSVIPVIEKANGIFLKFRILQAGLLGAGAGLAAGCLMALLNPSLADLGINHYDTSPQTLIIFSGLYGLLVHAAFKATEKRHITVRFLSVLLAMCMAFIIRFHPLVFQTTHPFIILNVIAASVPSCIFIALLWWMPAEKLKILYRPDLAAEDNNLNGRILNKIAFNSIIACLLSGLPMMNLAMNHNNMQFEIENSSETLKKSLNGKIFTREYVYDCASNKNTNYPATVSDLIKSCQTFDCQSNIICTSGDTCTDILFTDSAGKKLRINASFEYVSISPDGMMIAGRTKEGSIDIYEISSGKRLKEFPGKYVESLCWSLNGGKIFAVSTDKIPQICRVDIASGAVEKLFPGDMPRLIQCDGKIAYREKNTIKIFPPESCISINVWDNVPKKLYSYNISPCGKYLIYLKQADYLLSIPWSFLAVKTISNNSHGAILGEVRYRGFDSKKSIIWQNSQLETENAGTALKQK